MRIEGWEGNSKGLKGVFSFLDVDNENIEEKEV